LACKSTKKQAINKMQESEIDRERRWLEVIETRDPEAAATSP
jgi:hypothetical protein